MTNDNILNIILPYCGEAQGINQSEWLDAVEEFKPTQMKVRLFIIYSTSCDMEKQRKFIQRAKTLFDFVDVVAKYKPSPLTLESAVDFTTYCFMTAWPSFNKAGAGAFINPLWKPTQKYWLDNFIATMRIKQKAAIALATSSIDNKSTIYGCIGYSENFFKLFKNYKRFVVGSDFAERLGWEFKRFGHHASSDECPFEKFVSEPVNAQDVFATPKVEPATLVIEQPKKENPVVLVKTGAQAFDDLTSSVSDEEAEKLKEEKQIEMEKIKKEADDAEKAKLMASMFAEATILPALATPSDHDLPPVYYAHKGRGKYEAYDKDGFTTHKGLTKEEAQELVPDYKK